MVDSHTEYYKQSPQHEEAGLNIFRVPTLIISKKKTEIGRIIEYPVQSLERDMLSIIKSEPYVPRYRAAQFFLKSLPNTNVKSDAAWTETLKPLAQHRSEMNTVGYMLLASKKNESALQAFRINVLLYPQDVNVYNSLAEAYLISKDTSSARSLMQKPVAVDSANTETKNLLKRMNG
jgi:tetratricopeptide (TPR) repeat protein